MQLPEGQPLAGSGNGADGAAPQALSRLDNLTLWGVIIAGLVVVMLSGIGLYHLIGWGFCG